MKRRKSNRWLPHGGASTANILGLVVIFTIFPVALWAGIVGITYMEVETTTNAVASTVASAGCWNAASTTALNHGLAPLARLLPPSQVHVTDATAAYTPYGQPIVVTLSFPVAGWSGTGPTGQPIHFTTTRQMFSTAPSQANEGTPTCTTPPTTGS
ncbi:hypothetical protein [Sulfobacillus sp. hq2]|uniref:hypothetical protein n=1 Tax=Sulfobacillus TaxID=28033 RepID=UPI000CD2F993|nr:hypothetical protein [Sulfobacillus sp. hq2]POB12328.1 hypothetical protein CO251_00225 [Sulfobacillus sp. hq2]